MLHTIFIYMFNFSGFDVCTPAGKKKAHAIILHCSADLPAAAKVGNHMQYNGYYGCGTCDSSGTLVGRTMYWPFDDAAQLRTHDSILKCAEEATKQKKAVYTSLMHF